MKITVTHNIVQFRKQMTRIERKQIPFATAKALTDTAADAQRAATRQLPQKLDRPTRFTMRAIAYRPARKTRLESAVFVRPIQADYLRWQIDGGTRITGGAGTGVPTRNKRLNRFGNIPGRRSGLVKGKNQFVATIGGITGVWQRYAGKRARRHPKLLIAFERSVNYKPRYPFFKIVESVATNRFDINFAIAFNRALRTAM